MRREKLLILFFTLPPFYPLTVCFVSEPSEVSCFQEQTGVVQVSVVQLSRTWESTQLPIDAAEITITANITSLLSLGNIISLTTGSTLSVTANVTSGKFFYVRPVDINSRV